MNDIISEIQNPLHKNRETLCDHQGIDTKDMPTLSESFIHQLIGAAQEGREQSYSPYSHFSVGAAVLCEDGTIIKGCNIENASYGLTNCAERTAIFKAISEGKKRIQAMAIVADTEGPCAPCGACRQVIGEFNIPLIIMANMKGDYRIVTVEELLPFAFHSDHMA